jgi:hypothetical protein
VYLCAGSFVKSIIAGRYLLTEAIIFEHPTHNTSSRTRITVAQLLIHHPELFDIPHFIRSYYQYLHQVSSTLMIVVDNAMRLHLNRKRKLHATVAKATQSPCVSAILSVPVGHSSSSKTNSEIDCGGSSSVFNTFEGSKPRRTSALSRIGSRVASYPSSGRERRGPDGRCFAGKENGCVSSGGPGGRFAGGEECSGVLNGGVYGRVYRGGSGVGGYGEGISSGGFGNDPGQNSFDGGPNGGNHGRVLDG